MDPMLPLPVVVMRETRLKSIREERKKIDNKKSCIVQLVSHFWDYLRGHRCV